MMPTLSGEDPGEPEENNVQRSNANPNLKILTGAAVILLLLTVPAVVRAVRTNVAAQSVARQLLPVDACAPDEVRSRWAGGMVPSNLPLNLHAAVAAAGGSAESMPAEAEWERDPRLYAWFQAQFSAKQGNFPLSYAYLSRANAGPMLEAQGHGAFYTDPRCTLIVWALAHEIGGYTEPSWVVDHLAREGSWEVIAEAYERLLRYLPDRADWRMTLARAYVGLNRRPDAEAVLEPLLGSPSQATREAAENLLRSQEDQP